MEINLSDWVQVDLYYAFSIKTAYATQIAGLFILGICAGYFFAIHLKMHEEEDQICTFPNWNGIWLFAQDRIFNYGSRASKTVWVVWSCCLFAGNSSTLINLE